MEASLTCAVCLGVFRQPVTLPLCSHNFCKGCVRQCATPQSGSVYVQSCSAPPNFTAVTCPLCRKVSSLPGGLAALPVNTTLAEVVRLMSLSDEAKKKQTEAGAEEVDMFSSGVRAGYCPEHPEMRLELFCRGCAEPCCGKCVSLKHRGFFHSVNLLDVVLQEEKDILQKNTNVVTAAFDKVQEALDLKKRQLLDFIQETQSKSIKWSEVRKQMRVHHMKKVGSLLPECEKLVDVSEPKTFLQAACDLNEKMKSILDLIESTNVNCEDWLKSEHKCINVETVLEAISALEVTTLSSNGSLANIKGNFYFKTITRKWKPEIVPNEKYCPIQDNELYFLQGQMQKMVIRYISITKMPGYQHLSHEELRMKYYEGSVTQENAVLSLPKVQRQNVISDADRFQISIAGLGGLKDTRLVRQNAFDSGCTVGGKQKTFPETSARTELGTAHEMDRLSACMLKSPNNKSFKVQHFGSLASGLSSDTMVASEIKFGNESISKNVLPRFCIGSSDITAITKPCKNGRLDIKLKKAQTSLPTKVKIKSVKTNITLTGKSLDKLGNTYVSSDPQMTSPFCNPFSLQPSPKPANEVPEDMCSEEFYDACSHPNSDVEETPEQTSTCNNKEDKSLTLQKKQH
ncbi:E3 ubiquitin-protein ligase TRIM65-like isoform X2 [Pseudophryne corroboree]|uniref:E3 ubiquitin-protein ligase TRIM65-like isoform X2 n=1 Tax=Pseudophryne corroboree TaxID=495146 RepID=UPI00308187B0